MPRILILLILLSAVPAIGAPADNPQLPRNELAEINATLKEIAVLLKQQVAAQKGDLLLKRVGMATTQLAAAQERLKRIEGEIRAISSESSELDSRISRLQVAALESGETTEARNARLNDTRKGLASLQERWAALSQERISAQNEVGTLQRDARDWQATLDRMLASSP